MVLSGLYKYLSIGLFLSTIGLSISTLYYKSEYNSSQITVATLTANNIALESSIKTQNETIEYLKEDKRLLNTSIESLSNSQNQIFSQYNSAMNEIQSLRAEEAKRALENPYEMGNAAHDRIIKRLQYIAKGDRGSN